MRRQKTRGWCRSWLTLLGVNLKTTCFRLVEAVQVVVRYYRSPLFLLCDLLLLGNYGWRSPHRVSRAFLKARGERQLYTYGETPLTTLDHIMRRCQVLSTDLVYEMGCGAGRTSFWLHTFIRCRVYGIDHQPLFIQRATRLAHRMGMTALSFICADMCATTHHASQRLAGEGKSRNTRSQETASEYWGLEEATVVYLYGSALRTKQIHALLHAFIHLKAGTKVITISYPLTDYSKDYTVTQHFAVRFPWGRTTAFLQIKN